MERQYFNLVLVPRKSTFSYLWPRAQLGAANVFFEKDNNVEKGKMKSVFYQGGCVKWDTAV